ncbi:hypothetical protein MTQ92_12435, partial [Staphylococcus agnetis]
SWNVLARHNEPGQFPVWIGRCGNTLAVSYGAEFSTFKLYDDLSAFREFGHCVRHAVECGSKLDKE